jgi:hypothetical protein
LPEEQPLGKLSAKVKEELTWSTIKIHLC